MQPWIKEVPNGFHVMCEEGKPFYSTKDFWEAHEYATMVVKFNSIMDDIQLWIKEKTNA